MIAEKNWTHSVCMSTLWVYYANFWLCILSILVQRFLIIVPFEPMLLRAIDIMLALAMLDLHVYLCATFARMWPTSCQALSLSLAFAFVFIVTPFAFATIYTYFLYRNIHTLLASFFLGHPLILSMAFMYGKESMSVLNKNEATKNHIHYYRVCYIYMGWHSPYSPKSGIFYRLSTHNYMQKMRHRTKKKLLPTVLLG